MIQNESERYEKAVEFATLKHEGQFRIGGEPYIVHPLAVCKTVKDNGFGIDYQITALFHDLLEDTDAKESEILEIGGEKVLEAVKLLTKQKGYVMADYVAGIRKNPIAFAVKGADRLHNLQSAFCTSEDFKRRYILETIDWYLDFSPEIPKVVKELSQSMENPIAELPLGYSPVESDELKNPENK